MSTAYNPFFRYLYLLTALFAAVDLYVIFQKKLHREVPWFAIYLGFVAVSMICSDLVWEQKDEYLTFYTGWFVDGVVITLATMFILEGWQNLLHDYQGVRHLGRNVLIIVALFLLVLVAASAPFGSSQDKVLLMQKFLLRNFLMC